jgi:DNA-binding MarR family transcriptional regulator
MAVLMVNDDMDFNALKDLLDVTDGNLASHLKSLEASRYIKVIKEFKGRKPNTRYLATEAGRKAFVKHIEAIEQLLK